jgi:hypothetical protein
MNDNEQQTAHCLKNAYSGDVDRAIRVIPITQTGHGDRQSGER